MASSQHSELHDYDGSHDDAAQDAIGGHAGREGRGSPDHRAPAGSHSSVDRSPTPALSTSVPLAQSLTKLDTAALRQLINDPDYDPEYVDLAPNVAELCDWVERLEEQLALVENQYQLMREENANNLADVTRLEEQLETLEAALREGGCQFYLDGDIGACQESEETNPCAACAALGEVPNPASEPEGT